MKTRRFALAALALASLAEIGCLSLATANAAQPATWGSVKSLALDRGGRLNPEAVRVPNSGRVLFEECQANALASLSLAEAVKLTPFITGAKTPDNASLSEMIEITPIVLKFQAAFQAEMAQLSLGDVVKVTRYMAASGKARYPYPEIPADSKPAA